jgi:tetratricopeptide (TPR) repeat protein
LQLLALERPLLLVFEDLHWAEPTLLELLRSLADAEEPAPMLLVGSARPELKDAAPPILAAGGNRRVVELAPLSEDESRALMVELVGSAEAGGPFETLLRNAGGNPLFLEETVRMAADADVDPEALPVPDNLQALIGSRLDALPPPEKRVAQQASVVGGVFWAGAVAHVGGSNGDLPHRLGTLERREFVQAHADSTIAGDREYEFRHILIRDVAYDRLPKGRRAELHVRFSDWLGALPGPEEFVEIVAYHLEQACRLAAAIARSPIEPPVLAAASALATAAEKAQRREGWREAGRYYDRALAVLGEAHAERSLELRYSRARVHAAVGELGLAVEQLGVVAADALSLDRSDLRGMALATLGNIDHRQGRASEARRRLTEAQKLALELGDRSLQVRATYGLAAVRADYEAEAESAADELRAAVGVAQDMDDLPLRVEGHLRLGFLLFNMGDIAGSERELQRCLDLAGQLGSVHDEARATFLLGLVKHYRGDADEAARLGLQARDWLERTGDPYMQMQNFRALGLYALSRADLDAAEQWLREAIPIAVEEGGRPMLEVYRFLVETLALQGRIVDAATLVDLAGRNVPEEDVVAQTYVVLARAALAAALEDGDALALYAQGIDALERQFLPLEAADARMTFAAVLRRFGELDEARAQLTAARAVFERTGAVGSCRQVDRELAEVANGAG